jgi:hypothetical protein
MPSKYGFETEADRLAQMATAALPARERSAPEVLAARVHDVLADYTRAVCPGEQLTVIRDTTGRGWAAGTVGQAFDTQPLRVVLMGAGGTGTTLDLWCATNEGHRWGAQLDRLRDVLAGETGCVVALRTPTDIPDTAASRAPHAEPTVAHAHP